MGSCARTEILIGLEGIETLWHKHVLIAGLGGVGGACAEAICRAGVGKMTIIDHDVVSNSNINRQVIALHSTIGCTKVAVMRDRLLDINPELELHVKQCFIQADAVEDIANDDNIDFVLDCIDSIYCKAALVAACLKADKPVISAMGAGGRLDPQQVKVISLNQTHTDALSCEMRKALRRLGSRLNYPVVFSSEKAVKALAHAAVEATDICPADRARAVNGTISYMPNIFGLIMAAYVIRQWL